MPRQLTFEAIKGFCTRHKTSIIAVLLLIIVISSAINMSLGNESWDSSSEDPTTLKTIASSNAAQAEQNLVLEANSELSEPPLALENSETIDTSPPESVNSEIYVHVAGAVNNPGLVLLPSGARLAEAIELSGGFTPEAVQHAVNLASFLTDGQQIYVPSKDEQDYPLGSQNPSLKPPETSTSKAWPDEGDGLININLASETELQALPGIGPALASRIVEHRELNGTFTSIEQLQDVKGIGPASFQKLKDQIKV